jgi:hypothetical protein
MFELTNFTFYGKPFGYWYELRMAAEMGDYSKLIDQIVELKMKIAYYEQILGKIAMKMSLEEDKAGAAHGKNSQGAKTATRCAPTSAPVIETETKL